MTAAYSSSRCGRHPVCDAAGSIDGVPACGDCLKSVISPLFTPNGDASMVGSAGSPNQDARDPGSNGEPPSTRVLSPERPSKPIFRSDMTVTLDDYMASDAAVCRAARVSTKADSRGIDGDSGLIHYLMKSRHGTPFEHNAFRFYVEAPIFVFREWHRHRIGTSYNEESARYKVMDPVFYVPAEDRPLRQTGKPGRYEFHPGSVAQIAKVRSQLRINALDSYDNYQSLLDAGVAREVARMVLPVNTFSSMFVTLNARSLMHFLSLRRKVDGSTFPSYPQREIEMCAELLEDAWRLVMPETHYAFNKHGRVCP